MWKQLATEKAARYGAWLPIVLATVEAETGGRNVGGDAGAALGFGQVWPKWHRWAFDLAASDMGLSAPADHQQLAAFTHANDGYSMSVAVLVIKSYWDAAEGPDLESRWEAFTRKYVGPGIPSHDLERRRGIWHKYKGTPDVPISPPPPLGPDVGFDPVTMPTPTPTNVGVPVGIILIGAFGLAALAAGIMALEFKPEVVRSDAG